VSYVVYGMASSGNCHKIKMALEHLRLPYQWREIDTAIWAKLHQWQVK